MACALAASSPLATICRGVVGAAGLLLVWTMALTPTARAQTPPSPPSDLLQPSLQGNPLTLPRFQKPGQSAPLANQAPPTNTFTASSRIGATPTYGSPNGMGEGDTGYDSTNMPKGKRKKRAAQKAAAGPQPNGTFTQVPTFTRRLSAATGSATAKSAAGGLSEERGEAPRRNHTAATR